MRVTIDPTRCRGHGICAGISPEIFDVDDEGMGLILLPGKIPSEMYAEVHQAVLNCPEHAITTA